jgi:hypothetical protein
LSIATFVGSTAENLYFFGAYLSASLLLLLNLESFEKPEEEHLVSFRLFSDDV